MLTYFSKVFTILASEKITFNQQCLRKCWNNTRAVFMNTKNNQLYKTKELHLKETLLELLKEQDFKSITVKELCKKANVNRSTFYAHFIDIYDLTEKTEEYLTQKMLDSYPTASQDENVLFPMWPFIPFLKHIKKYKYFYKIALDQRRSFPIARGYDSMLNQIIIPQCANAGITDESEIMYYFVYFQAGFTFTLKRWVENDCKESEQEIAKIIENCVPAIWAKIAIL